MRKEKNLGAREHVIKKIRVIGKPEVTARVEELV